MYNPVEEAQKAVGKVASAPTQMLGGGGGGGAFDIQSLLSGGAGGAGGLLGMLGQGGALSGLGGGLLGSLVGGNSIWSKMNQFVNPDKAHYDAGVTKPDMPKFNTPFNYGADGTVSDLSAPFKKAAFTIDADKYRPDEGALNAMKSRAMDPGDSNWLKLQMQQNGVNQRNMTDQGIRQAGSATAQAQSNLAMRGGMSTGARERIAAQGLEGQANAGQNAAMAASNNENALRIQDDQTKTDLLTKIPGLDIASKGFSAGLDQWNQGQKSDTDAFNVTNSMNGLGMDTDAKKFTYGEGMKTYAAGKQAEAIGNSGKK
jgi:hypothetical protein